jgi:predicted component of type VI protein secretion system
MSFNSDDLVQKRIAEILMERENIKKQEEERRKQAELEAEIRRAFIQAQLEEKRRLEEERRFKEEIDREAILAIISIKQDEIKKKYDEIELYRQEIIRVQLEISKINDDIISFNELLSLKKAWKGLEYEVDNSNSSINKINTLNDSLKLLINVIRNNGKITLRKLIELIILDESFANIIRGEINDIRLSKIVENKMKILIELGILREYIA